nr:hypothetical protein [Burkholderia multivorans]
MTAPPEDAGQRAGGPVQTASGSVERTVLRKRQHGDAREIDLARCRILNAAHEVLRFALELHRVDPIHHITAAHVDDERDQCSSSHHARGFDQRKLPLLSAAPFADVQSFGLVRLVDLVHVGCS